MRVCYIGIIVSLYMRKPRNYFWGFVFKTRNLSQYPWGEKKEIEEELILKVWKMQHFELLKNKISVPLNSLFLL